MLDAARQMLAALPFNRHLGLEFQGDGGVVLPERDELKNHIGTQHAGALFTVGEAASGLALAASLADLLGTAIPVARRASIEYKKIARGPITARGTLAEPAEAIRARLASDGKVTFDVNVSLRDAAGEEVVTVVVAWYMRRQA